MLELTDKNFEAEVIKSDKLVVVDFWAGWCGPCRMMAPSFDSLAVKNPAVKFGKMNVDENSITPSTYRVASIPTIMAFKDGRVKDMTVGALPESELQKFIDRNK